MTFVVQNPHASFRVQVAEAHQQENQPKILQIGVPEISQRAIGVGDLNFVHQSQDLLTGPKGNFQETVSASPIIQKENHILGIDLADHIKEETQIQKAAHVGNLTGLRENFRETVSASPIVSHTLQKEHPTLGKEIESQDLIKEEIQIQKTAHVGNLTGLRGNFQGTVRASHLIQKENHMQGIDRTELFK